MSVAEHITQINVRAKLLSKPCIVGFGLSGTPYPFAFPAHEVDMECAIDTVRRNGEMNAGKSISCVATCALLLAAGCGGQEANPVSRYMPGDEDRSCRGLRVEIADNENEMERLLPDKDATGKNVALGVAGAFLIVPWFFMDFKEGEAIELKALDRRNEWLREVAIEKGCEVPPARIKFEDKPKEPKAKRESCC